MGKLYKFLAPSARSCAIWTRETKSRLLTTAILYSTITSWDSTIFRTTWQCIKEYGAEELNYAIVDEVDSILIDRAKNASYHIGQGGSSTGAVPDRGSVCVQQTSGLRRDYEAGVKAEGIKLTEQGIKRQSSSFNVENFSDGKRDR